MPFLPHIHPRILSIGVPFIALLICSGCFVPLQVGQRMQSDISSLKKTVAELTQAMDGQQAQLHEQIKRSQEKIEEVSLALQDLNRSARSTDADFGVQLERLGRDVQELRGAVELAEHQLHQASERQAMQTGSSEGTGTTGDLGVGSGSAGKNKDVMLKQAKEWLKAGKRQDARGLLREVVHTWPKDPGVTDVAYYLLGETYVDEKKYQTAVQEYIQIVERFPQSQYVDDAYYRIGVCSMEIGNLEDAELFLTEVVKRFKQSPVSAQAAVKLKEVQKRLAKEKKAAVGKRAPAKKK